LLAQVESFDLGSSPLFVFCVERKPQMNLLLPTLLAGVLMANSGEAAPVQKTAALPVSKGTSAAKPAPMPNTANAAKAKTVAVVHPVEAKIVERTNQERVRRGLRPLRLDMRLMRTARRHNGWMARSGAFQHGNYPVAENIAMGQQNSAQAMNSWMNSSGHRANILNASYNKIGVSAYRSSNGSIYWTQQFQQ
jgi:uncharacterized protein YkwD